jgi:indole-3-glycerol phosphate synthase
MPAYLDKIIAAHRAGATADHRDLDELAELALASAPARPFVAAIEQAWRERRMAVISEIKRRSPSKGDLDPTLDPALVAADYELGGATCLSVLTDAEFFGGSAADLASARDACALPVLRKDFTVDARDVCDARIMGADAVLLIVAALDDRELSELLALAERCGLAALVEIHDEVELRRAVEAGARVIGVNQRDLRTFQVDHQRALTLGAAMPDGVCRVAESGIKGGDDVRRLIDAGYQAVLVGETLVRSGDRRAAVGRLLSAAP